MPCGELHLTFDNGPDPEVTPFVLDCLARHNLKTTFFVLGEKVSDPACARIAMRAGEEGHRVGNHTFTHTVPLGDLDRDTALAEFERTERALDWLTQPRRLFRPFGGGGAIGPHLLHSAVVEKLEAGGYTCVLWNCVPGDWKYPDTQVDPRSPDPCRPLVPGASWCFTIFPPGLWRISTSSSAVCGTKMSNSRRTIPRIACLLLMDGSYRPWRRICVSHESY